jgi:hypothetical protein
VRCKSGCSNVYDGATRRQMSFALGYPSTISKATVQQFLGVSISISDSGLQYLHLINGGVNEFKRVNNES